MALDGTMLMHLLDVIGSLADGFGLQVPDGHGGFNPVVDPTQIVMGFLNNPGLLQKTIQDLANNKDWMNVVGFTPQDAFQLWQAVGQQDLGQLMTQVTGSDGFRSILEAQGATPLSENVIGPSVTEAPGGVRTDPTAVQAMTPAGPPGQAPPSPTEGFGQGQGTATPPGGFESAVAGLGGGGAGGGGGGARTGAAFSPQGATTTGNVPGPNPNDPANMTDDQIVAFVKSQYTFESWMLDDPELRKVLISSIRNHVDPDTAVGQAQIASAVMNTSFGKTHTEKQVEYLQAKAEHPADYDPNNPGSIYSERFLQIKQQAVQLGINVPDAVLAHLTETSLQNGWDMGSQDMEKAVRSLYNYRPPNTKGNIPAHMGANGYLVDDNTGRRAYYGPNGEPAGPAPFPGASSYQQKDGTTVYYTPGDFAYANSVLSGQTSTLTNQFMQMAHDYNLSLSPDAINKYVQAVIQQQDTPDGAAFTQYLKDTAKAMYPFLGTMIDQGFTPKQILDPYQQTISTMLGLPSDSIDFTNPKYKNLLTTVGPDGTPTLNSEFQMQKMIRADPSYGWQNTPDANNQAAQFTTKVLQTFGAIGS